MARLPGSLRSLAMTALVAFHLAGCAGLEPALNQASPNPRPSSLAGFQKYESLHFVVQTRDYHHSKQIAEIAEQIYEKVMFDTNLMSFKPRQNYPILVFSGPDEYHEQTGYPAWSGGGAATELLGQVLPGEREIKALTSIYTFETVLSEALLAHEISHLIFNEYMEFFTTRDSDRVRWLNEGFATFQEIEAYGPQARSALLELTRSLLPQNAISLERLVNFNPFNEAAVTLGSCNFQGRHYLYTNIDLWYWQVRELTGFLIASQGRYHFYLLMNALKSGKTLSEAVRDAYPGKWRSLSELENEWKQTLR